jgi:hypothetical protein
MRDEEGRALPGEDEGFSRMQAWAPCDIQMQGKHLAHDENAEPHGKEVKSHAFAAFAEPHAFENTGMYVCKILRWAQGCCSAA